MELAGKKNLNLTKRALLSHIVYCSIKAERGTEKEMKETWDPEIKATEQLLKNIEVNIGREDSADDTEVLTYP